MSLIDALTDRLQAHTYAASAIAAVGFLIVYSLYSRLSQERRINRLGSRATIVLPFRLPYGV